MKKIYLTFGGRAYDATTEKIVSQAPGFGADQVLVYDDRWLAEHEYFSLNRWLWETPTKFGFGWCAWKAAIILDAFKKLNDTDIVLYTDADTYPVSNLNPIYEMCASEGGILLFEEQGCPNRRFTKMDCILSMGLEPEFVFGNKINPHGISACGRFQVFQKGRYRTEQFLYEWLSYSINPRCQLWDTSILKPDQPEFGRHSCEQSILGNLACKYQVPLHRTPDQNGFPASPDKPGTPEYDRFHGCGQGAKDTYPQLFVQRYCEGNRDDLSGSQYRNV